MPDISITRRWSRYWYAVATLCIFTGTVIGISAFSVIYYYLKGSYGLAGALLYCLTPLAFLLWLAYMIFDFTRSVKSRFTEDGIEQMTLSGAQCLRWGEMETIEIYSRMVIAGKGKKVVLHVELFDQGELFSLIKRKTAKAMSNQEEAERA